MEKLKVLHENGQPTGVVKARDEIHKDGDIHGVVRIYVCRFYNGAWEVLIQRRSEDCLAFPSSFDISCAGHIAYNETSLDAAARELKEELGIQCNDTLVYVTSSYEDYSAFQTSDFIDREYNDIYVYDSDVAIDQLTIQKEEVDTIFWLPFVELMKMVELPSTEYCVSKKEVKTIMQYLHEKR